MSSTRGGEAVTLIAALRDRGWRVAVAESVTGGEVLARLTAVPGASRVVWGGGVVYTAAAKVALAGVSEALIGRCGVVSEQVTVGLAEGIRRRAGVDLGIAVTGWAGPDSDGVDPVGTVYLAAAVEEDTTVRRLHYEGDRASIRAAAVDGLLALAHGAVQGRA